MGFQLPAHSFQPKDKEEKERKKENMGFHLPVLSLRGSETTEAISLNREKLKIMDKRYFVYIMTNKWNTTFYTGVTNNLKKRIYEHKEKFVDGFTKKYNINKLVYYEIFNDIYKAIEREKQIKAGSRRKKVELIKGMNPEWIDLYDEL